MKHKEPKRTLKKRRRDRIKALLPRVENHLKKIREKGGVNITAERLSDDLELSRKRANNCLLALVKKRVVSPPYRSNHRRAYNILLEVKLPPMPPLAGRSNYYEFDYGNFIITVRKVGHKDASRWKFTYKGRQILSWTQRIGKISKHRVLREFRAKRTLLVMGAYEEE